jgi:NAD-dependent dihydropyrimidine dehydrogenase PreA subunit
MPTDTLTIYCHCAYYQIVHEQTKSAILNALKNTGTEFQAVADLCQMSANRDPALKLWAKAESIKIIACYPRAVRWLFHAGGAPLSQGDIEFFNMRVDGAEKIISSLAGGHVRSHPSKDANLEKTGDWIPWFPVIDYDRCKNCKQCLNFCLFGVYKLSVEGKVEVCNPANCKTNCPACARLCPQSAIIFPKYSDSPINGDEVKESASSGIDEKTKADLASLLGGNVYDAIRRRSKGINRFPKDTKKMKQRL